MYNYGELELSILCCFWLKPELLETTKLNEKHFINNKKIFILFQSFYKKFGNLNIESMCSLVNDNYKLMDYMKIIIEREPTISHFQKYESLLIELYEESEQEKWLREKVFELANDFYMKNINSKQFKEQIDNLYKNVNN